MAEEQLPIWNAVGVEPPELLKTDGWQPGMKPSAQHMNWLFNRIYKCLEEIQAGGGTEELKQELVTLQQALATHLAEEATLTEAGHVMLSNLINGSSETKAATELAVKNAIAHLKSWSPNASTIVVTEDPNTTQNSLIYSKHANNPTSDVFYYIETLFYESKSTTIGNWQFAKQDTTDEYVFVRSRYGNAWNPWRRMITDNMKNVPGGVVGIDQNGKVKLPGGLDTDYEIRMLKVLTH